MWRFIIKRLLLVALMLIGLLAITFFISHIAPSDPAALAAGPDADREMIERYRVEYGLDKPVHVQFAHYLARLAGGDWGRSIRTTRSVSEDLLAYFPNTLELVAFSIAIAIVLGIPLGVLAAVHQNRPADHVIRLVTVSGVAMPMFWLGLMLQLYFSLHLGWFPLGSRLGMLTEPPGAITHLLLVDTLLRGQFGAFAEAVHHMILPAVALCFPALASIIRVNRAEMLETLNQDYITNATAHGLPRGRIVAVYALKNAMLPTLAIIGLRFGWMLGGTVLVETVFDWPGVGLYAVQAIISSDFEPIMGATIVLGVFFMLTNLVIDIVYAVMDPRVREQI